MPRVPPPGHQRVQALAHAGVVRYTHGMAEHLDITGTCPACEQAVPWTTSTLGRHAAPASADPSDATQVRQQRGGRPAVYSRDPLRYTCAGSYQAPVEAARAKGRPMTPAERKLAGSILGGL